MNKQILEFDLGEGKGYPFIEILIESENKKELNKLKRKFLDLEFSPLVSYDTFAILKVTDYSHTIKEMISLITQLEGCGFVWK